MARKHGGKGTRRGWSQREGRKRAAVRWLLRNPRDWEGFGLFNDEEDGNGWMMIALKLIKAGIYPEGTDLFKIEVAALVDKARAERKARR